MTKSKSGEESFPTCSFSQNLYIHILVYFYYFWYLTRRCSIPEKPQQSILHHYDHTKQPQGRGYPLFLLCFCSAFSTLSPLFYSLVSTSLLYLLTVPQEVPPVTKNLPFFVMSPHNMSSSCITSIGVITLFVSIEHIRKV